MFCGKGRERKSVCGWGFFGGTLIFIRVCVNLIRSVVRCEDFHDNGVLGACLGV